MMRMACPCGKILKVDEAHIGRRARCPACGISLVVGDSAITGRPPPAPAPAAAPARRAPAPQPRRTPAPQASGGSSYALVLLLLLGVGAIAGVLLLGAGVGAYFFLIARRDSDTLNAAQNAKDKEGGQGNPGGPGGQGGQKTTYTIKLTVPKKVGEVREHNYSGVLDNWTDLPNGQVGVTRDEFKGTVKTLAVDDKGRETKAEVTTRTFKRERFGQESVLLQPGQYAVLRLNYPTVLVEDKNGQPLFGDGFKQLNLAINIEATHADSFTDDQLFGTNDRKAIGDTWPINRELYHRQFTHRIAKEVRPVIGQDAVSGTCKLVGTAKVDGLTYLDVEVEVTVKLNNARMDDGDLPPLNMYATGSHKIVWSFRVAADGSTGALKRVQKVDIDREISGSNDSGQPVRYKERVKTTYSDEFKYLGSNPGGGKGKFGARAPEPEPPLPQGRERTLTAALPMPAAPAASRGTGA